jgi:ParB/RepB/Spo0J family partition protein
MDETKKEEGKKIKTREGSGYLRQLYSTARSTAGTTPSNFKSLTTFLVNFIPVDKVDASELQVRTHFDEDEIKALSHSIKEHGVLQPVLVVQNGDRYKVIAGERRLRASKMAGIERIPARVITSDDKGVHEIALRENLDRVDLHPIEEGEGYVSLLEAQAYTSYEGIAAAFGKQKSRITECISYTRLPEETKQLVMNRGIKQRALLRKLLSTPPEQHAEIIAQNAGADLSDDLGTGYSASSTEKPSASPKTATSQKKVVAFAYECSPKGIAVPGFRWKAGEGPERLKDYIEKLYALIAEAEKLAEPNKDPSSSSELVSESASPSESTSE